MEKMVKTRFVLKKSETLNERIYQEFSAQQGLYPSLVRGTGTFRQFVPVASRGNIFDRPPRGSRHLWAKKPYSHFINNKGRGPLGFITTVILTKESALQLEKLLLSKKNYSIVKQIFAIYYYFRYLKLIYKIGKIVVQNFIKQLKRNLFLFGQNEIRRSYKVTFGSTYWTQM